MYGLASIKHNDAIADGDMRRVKLHYKPDLNCWFDENGFAVATVPTVGGPWPLETPEHALTLVYGDPVWDLTFD